MAGTQPKHQQKRPQPATIAFVAAAVAAFALLVWLGRDEWFFNDDWGQWADNRAGTGLGDRVRFVFAPHNGHWMSLNRVVFEGTYRVFGLHSYMPYLLWMLAVHIGAASCLWLVCRRAVADAWVASATATVFLFFGAGAEVLGWADSFGFAAPLLFGTAQLLLTDHDGPLDRRDGLGLAAGALSIMSGGPALVMVAVVGIALVLRRRWVPAAVATVPLALAWGLWWLAIGHEHDAEVVTRSTAGLVAPYFNAGVLGVLDALSRLGIAGVLAVGLVLLVSWQAPAMTRRGTAPVLAMATGFVLFFGQAALARVKLGPEQASSSRYLYVGAFLVLPLMAYGVDVVLARLPALRWGVVALAAWVIVSNLSLLYEWNRHWEPIERDMELAVAAVLARPGIDEVDPRARVVDPQERFDGSWLPPVGVLVRLRDRGDLPDWGPVSEDERERWQDLRLEDPER